MPTNSTSKLASQSLSSNSPCVVAANSSVFWRTLPPSAAILTQAVTEDLCTSSPQQRSVTLSISLPSAGDSYCVAEGSLITKSLVCVLSMRRRQLGVPEAPTSHFFTGSAAPSNADVS